MEAPQLKRGLFGYTPKSVRLILADRDKMFVRASEQARAAEALVLELRAEAEALKTQLEGQVQRIRALEAEAADLRTDRNATRVELEGAVADAARLGLELETTRRELETVRHDLDIARHELETTRQELAQQEERVRAAEDLSAQRNGDLELLRRELGSARRDFLIQNQRARSAEMRLDELEAELRSVRVELEAEIASARAELGAARTAADEAAARPAPEAPATAAELSAALEAAERAMVRIMDGARGRAAEELREAERARRETLAEIERLAAWRDRLAPLVGAVRSSIEDARGRAAGIGERVGEAVDPLSEAISALSDRLAAFAELAAPPTADGLATQRPLRVIELDEERGAPDHVDPARPSWI